MPSRSRKPDSKARSTSTRSSMTHVSMSGFRAGECDLVIIATPVHAAREWFERLEANGYDGVITDVASTKAVITGYSDEVLSRPDLYLPGHPMAGSEANGLRCRARRPLPGCLLDSLP